MGFIVHCKLPNASENISGVAFKRHPEGHMHTEELEPEVAKRFAGIGGYTLEDPAPPTDVERDGLLFEAEGLGLKIDGRWKTDKVRDAVAAEKAKRAAAEAAE